MQVKPALAIADWPIDWSAQMTTGEAIVAQSWSVSPVVSGGLAVVAGSEAVVGTVTACFVEGGHEGRVYELVNVVTTDSSPARRLVRTVTILIGPAEAVA